MADKLAKKVKFGIETDNDLVLSTVQLPFGNKTGALTNIYTSESGISNILADLETIPGVMVLDLVPSIGRNNTSLNTYIGKLYARLIRKISGAKDIEKCDQFMYIEIGKTCVDMVCKLKTIYELAFMYQEYNLYWPKGILYALGMNADDFAANLEDFRAWVNRVIARLRSFNFPNISYLKSGWEYGRTILVDSPDLTRAQVYICNFRFLYSWDPIGDPNGTRLNINNFYGTGANTTFSTLRTMVDGLIDSFAYDQDFIDISAWYDHLYEGNPEGLLKFTDCTPTMEHVQITYDPDALLVIENAECLPATSNANSTFRIVQLSNTVSQAMAFDLSATGTADEKANIGFVKPHICNCHKPKPTSKDVAKYCTFKYEFDVYKAGRDGNFPVSAAIYVNTTNDYCVYDMKTVQLVSGSFTPVSYAAAMVSNVVGDKSPIFQQFTNRPFCNYTEYKISSGQYTYVTGTSYLRYNFYSDLDNYIEITNAILKNYHAAVWFTNLEDK
jgi:hypothetical protein